ncbi:MAG: hypothetical protein M3524_08710 [Actinomycetota bacterium]|nr:hypothetical protein [Actinomycetota bacterium]
MVGSADSIEAGRAVQRHGGVVLLDAQAQRLVAVEAGLADQRRKQRTSDANGRGRL